ncbi:MAG TPA: protein kinase [Thermoanaerobaculia bacterium]|nr:protein kinase [Thermoanaerobaculia bacterium]
MSIAAGIRLGPYEILGLIGVGGMGEVYRARDPRIGRDVAIKVLPAAFSADEVRLERFQQEARAAGLLNHPNLLTIYELGTHEGVPYIVSELLEGETLRDRLRGGALTPRRTVDYGIQIARGLAVAHGRGIVHRDIKPENLFITKDGRVKILDFGLAKLRLPNERVSEEHTLARQTDPGAVMGTAGYMSPEQVRGDVVDQRSDIFSLGTVLHEALTGEAPFKRNSSVETMNAILRGDPSEITVRNPQVNSAVAKVVSRCLEKHPEARYQSAADLAYHLEDLSDISAPAPGNRGVGRHLFRGGESAAKRKPWPAVVVPVMLLLLIVVAVVAYRRLRPPAHTATMRITRLTNSGNVAYGAISPDGKYVVYTTAERGGWTLWLRQVASGTTVRLRAPGGGIYSQIGFSPDSNYVYYMAGPSLNELPILGGEPRQIAARGDRFAISPDGKSVVIRRENPALSEYTLTIASMEHGSERVVLRRRYPDVIGTGLSWSSVRVVDFFEANVDRDDRPFLSELDLTTNQVRPISKIDWPGRHWFRATTSLVALPDGSGWIISNVDVIQPPQVWLIARDGAPRQITSDLASYTGLTMTADGSTIAARRSDPSTNLWIVPSDGSTAERALTTGVGNAYGAGGARWMSDAEVLFSDVSDGKVLLRALNIAAGTMRELTTDVMTWRFAVSSDRNRLAFISDATGFTEVWTSRIDGKQARQLTHELVQPTAPSWFPDNRTLAYASAGRVSAVWKRTIDQPKAIRLTDVPATIPEIAPDGKSFLCRVRTAESGVWKTALLDLAGNAPPRYFDIPVSNVPSGLRWMRDETAYVCAETLDGAPNIFVQPIRGGEPRQITHFQRGIIFDYDVSRDGKSIVLSHREPADDMVLMRDFH